MTTPRKMPDDRPWITGYSVSPTSGRIVDKAGREVSGREFLHRTGWALQQVRKRMTFYGFTLDEAINAPQPKRKGGRIGSTALLTWVHDVYRPWVASIAGKLPEEAAPPPEALPQPNGPEPAPEPPEPVPEASQPLPPFTLRIEAVTPDLVLKAFEAMADRLDAIEAQLAILNKELH